MELEINEKILGITNKIRDKHPELLSYLNELPLTVPNQENTELSFKSLQCYYESLVNILHEYEKSHAPNEITVNEEIIEQSEF